MRTPLSSRAWRGVIAALALILAFPVQGQPATFAPADPYTVGSTTYSAAAGDLDGDGDLDLVAVNFSDRTASVLLGTGDGTFGAATAIALGDPGDIDNAVRAVSLGDVDGDGDLDAVATGNAGRIFTLLGAGDGTFPTIVEAAPAAGGNVYEAALASLDADGDLDLVLAGGSNLIVYDGDGAGGFAPVAFIDLDNGSAQRTGLAVGDFDGDTWPDVAAGNGDSGVIVVLNDGTGSFTTPSFYDTSASAFDIAAGDLDEDGDLDLAVAGGFVSGTTILLNGGSGTFTTGGTYSGPSLSWSIEAADVNLDGDVDLLLGAGSSGVSVVRGQGDGTFLPDEDYTTGLATTYGVIAADFDGDTKTDFVATDAGTAATDGRIAVRLNTTEPPVTELNLFVTESILVSDAPRVLPALMLSVQESVGVTDDPTLLLALLLAVQETIAVTDDPALLPALLLAVQEMVGVNDDPSFLLPLLLAIEESVGVTDQPDLLLPLLLAVQETVGVIDQPNLLPALLLAVAERVGVTDDPVLRPALLLAIQEAIAVSDDPVLTPALVLAIREAIAVSDDPVLAVALLLRIQELIAVADAFGAVLGVAGLITTLDAAVADLIAAGVLTRREGQGLLKKLDQIRKKVERGQYDVALNVLDAFTNQVELYRAEGTLTDAQADGLIAQAQALETAIEQLMNPNKAAADAPTSASRGAALPAEFALGAAYPNPFQRTTTITYALPEDAEVRLTVYDTLGRTVAVLVERAQTAGFYAASFNARGLASGIYLYRIVSGSYTETGKMLLAR